jgi:hypothetical protein
MRANPSHHITTVESSGPSGITGASCCPPMGPYLITYPQTYSPANSEGAPYSADLILSHRLPQLSVTGTRVAIYRALCPRVLPCPCPGQHAHQGALTDREGRKLEITWMTPLLPKADSCRSSNPEVGCLLCSTSGHCSTMP